MKEQIEFKGASGAAYRFRIAENGDPKTTISGNFVYVRDAGEPEIVYVGATTNLASGVREKWDEAVEGARRDAHLHAPEHRRRCAGCRSWTI